MPADVRGMHIFNVSARAFSLRWEQAVGCVDHYLVNLQPNKGKVIVRPARDGYIQVHKHETTLDSGSSALSFGYVQSGQCWNGQTLWLS